MVASSGQGVTARVVRKRPAAPTVKPVARLPAPDPESELWSFFGYDTVCLFWGLPLRAFHALSETERWTLARVSNRIDRMSAADKEPFLREIGRAAPMKRLETFRRLGRALAAGRRLVAKPPPAGRRPRSST